MHCSGVVCMVVHDDRDVESLFRASPLEMLSDLLLSVQQLSYEGGIKVVVESGVFLLVLQFVDVLSERIKSIIHCCRRTEPVDATKLPP